MCESDRELENILRKIFPDEQEPNARLASREEVFRRISDISSEAFKPTFRIPDRTGFIFQLVRNIKEDFGAEALLLMRNRTVAELIKIGVSLQNTEIAMNSLEDSSSPKTPKIDWIQVLGESAKGLPGGEIVLGGLLKHYESVKGAQDREVLAQRIDAIVKANTTVTLEEVRQMFAESAAQTAELQLGLRAVTAILEAQRKEFQAHGKSIEPGKVAGILNVTQWPVPGIPQDLLEEELLTVITSGPDAQELRELLERYYKIDTSHMGTKAALIFAFTRSISGRHKRTVLQVLEGLHSFKSDSAILAEFLVAWRMYVEN